MQHVKCTPGFTVHHVRCVLGDLVLNSEHAQSLDGWYYQLLVPTTPETKKQWSLNYQVLVALLTIISSSMGVNLMQVCVHMCVLRNIRFISTGVYCNTAAFLTSPHIVSTFGVQLQETFKTNEIAGVLHLLIHLTNLVTYSWSYL